MKNLISLVMVLAVSVVIIGGTLAPYIGNVTAETKIYENEGVPYAAFDDETHTIVVSYDGSGYVVTMDGEACELPNLSLYGAATLVFGDDAFIRVSKFGQVRGYINDAMVQGGNVSSSVTSTIVISDTGATMTFGSTTNTMSFTPLAHIAPSGEYSLSSSPCVVDDSVIIAGVTVVSSDALGYVAYGTIDNLTASVVYVDGFDDATVSDLTYTVNTSSVATNLVKIDSVVFDATMSDSSTFTGTYTYFLAPAEIEYDNPDYLGASNAALIGVMVLLAIAALLVVTVRYVSREY